MSSTTDPGSRSAAEIEREVEQTRAGLTDTLDAIRERASPGQLFEQALDYVRSSGGSELMRNLGTSVRDNPLPLLLIGAGVGWLMMGGGSRTGRSASSDTFVPSQSTAEADTPISGTVETTASPARHNSAVVATARDGTTSAAAQVSDKAGQAYRSIAEAAGSAAESIRDTAGSVADSVRGAATAVTERVIGSGSEIEARASELGDQAQHGVTWLMREQPLVLGAIGVALGAAVGALLPSTEAENQLMGETRDTIANRVGAAAQQGYERLKESAGEHVADVKGAVGQAANQAVGSGPIGSSLTEAARDVRQVVQNAAHDFASEARATIEGKTPQEGTAPPSAPSSPRTDPL